MKQLSLTIQQRVGIDNLIAAQTGSPGKLRPLVDVQRKIAITEAESITAKLMRLPLDNGQVEIRWNEEGANEVGSVRFELENDQHASLRSLIKNHEGYRSVDMMWVDPLIDDLDNKENDLDKRKT